MFSLSLLLSLFISLSHAHKHTFTQICIVTTYLFFSFLCFKPVSQQKYCYLEKILVVIYVFRFSDTKFNGFPKDKLAHVKNIIF